MQASSGKIVLVLLAALAAGPALADTPTACEKAKEADLKRMNTGSLALQFCQGWRTARLNDDSGNDNMKLADQLRRDGRRREALEASASAGSFFTEADACRDEAVRASRMLEKDKKISVKQYEALLKQTCPDVVDDMDAIIAATKGTALPSETQRRPK